MQVTQYTSKINWSGVRGLRLLPPKNKKAVLVGRITMQSFKIGQLLTKVSVCGYLMTKARFTLFSVFRVPLKMINGADHSITLRIPVGTFMVILIHGLYPLASMLLVLQ